MLTADEQEQLNKLRQKMDKVKSLLCQASFDDDDLVSWHKRLSELKNITGNPHNDMNRIACLLAKRYLCKKLNMRQYEALAKAQGAKGLDIAEFTANGEAVVAEIKTTNAFNHNDIRSPQKEAIVKDLSRLAKTDAKFKFFFVTDVGVF